METLCDPAQMSHLDGDGRPMRWVTVADRQAIVRSDTEHLMGIFAPGYAMHQYRQWLLTTVADTLAIAVAFAP